MTLSAMKECPKCNRTYSDDSLAFCLVDGAILSAPFDSAPTLVLDEVSVQSTARRPNNQRFLYIVIIILVALAAGSAVALFYERSKPDLSTSNSKAPEIVPITKHNSSSNLDTSKALTTRDLNGEWELVNTIKSSSYPAYINAQAGFRLFIKQVGKEITAEGEKVWMSGRELEPDEHSPIHVNGFIKEDSIEATFVEEGAQRKSSGRFVWRIEGYNRLIGTFISTAADTNGTSIVTKK